MLTRSDGHPVFVRERHGLRAWLVAAVLTGVGAASLFDGQAADFVAGGDGDDFVTHAAAELGFSAADAPHAPDVCAAAPKAVRLVAVVGSPWPLYRSAPAGLDTAVPGARIRLGASGPRSSRAPPAD